VRLAIFALTAGLIGLPALAFADDAPTAPAPAASPTSSEVVASAGGTAPVATPSGDTSLGRWLDDEPTIIDLNNRQAGDLTAPRAVHGYVSVGVGSNGYRDFSAGAVIPVGKTSELGVAVDDEQLSYRHRKFEQRNLAVSLAIGVAHAAPDDCASAIRVGDHYVEPLWATQIRGSALSGVDPRCMSEPQR
jgi:hypothetical protein